MHSPGNSDILLKALTVLSLVHCSRYCSRSLIPESYSVQDQPFPSSPPVPGSTSTRARLGAPTVTLYLQVDTN